MGTRKRAWTEVSKIIGVNPKNVVNEVSKIGRNRRVPAWLIASLAESCRVVRRLLAVTISTSESLITTPDRATIPNRLMTLRS